MAKTPTDIRTLARAHTDTALNVLAGIMMQPKAPHAARVAAAQALLDRGWGKAAQAIGGTDVLPPIAIQSLVRKIVDPVSERPQADTAPTQPITNPLNTQH